MSTTTKEQEWALALKRAKHQLGGRQQTVSFDIQKKQVKEELDHFKKILHQAFQDQNQTELDRAVNRLITLRAKQVGIHLQEETDQGFTINSFMLERACRRYYHDCYRLLDSVHALRSY